jgi:hypothetical protein
MMTDQDRHPSAEEKTYDLLSRAGRGLEITTRDDQQEFVSLLDAAKAARRRGGRLRLVDAGRFGAFELEWLAEAGADLYTSDEARPNKVDLGLLARACARGDSILAYFHHGVLAADSGDTPASPGFLADLGRDGVDVHLSNREQTRDLTGLAAVADHFRKAGSRFVYYHHGSPAAALAGLGRSGAWVHLSDRDFPAGGGGEPVTDIAAEAAAAGSGLVIHLERGLPAKRVLELLKAGAFVLFRTPPADLKSPLRALERQARRRRLDRRSFYLYPDFLL